MAARKDSENITHSQRHAGDELFDLCCSPCAEKKLNKQAVKYCATCKEYFCASCVESHKIFKALSKHVLLEPQTSRPTSSRSGTTKFHALPTQLCKKHSMEVINMYCQSEDVVGCSVCFLHEHKFCNDNHYIPEYVHSNFPTNQVKQINTDLTKAIKAMTKLKTQHDRLDDNLDKCKATCKLEIQKYRAEINCIIDKIEAATMAKLDARHTKKKTGDTDHNIQDVHDEMMRFKTEIESDQSNDSQKFVIAKLSQCLMRQGQELQSELTDDQTTQLTFTRNTDIMNFLLSIVTLGLLSPPLIQKQSLYKILSKSKHKIRQQNDEDTCDIRSSFILDDGNILLADYGNDKLKLVDSRTYTVRSSIELDASPWSVCRVNSTEAAVCLDDDTIQFVSTCDKLVPIRSLSMKHKCVCIAVIRDKMYVCDDKSVYIHTLNGKLVRTISKDKSGNAIFSQIKDITVSDDEKMIHVADWKEGVITLNTDGNGVWRYPGTQLSGVCTDGNGRVIVCDNVSDNVIQLGSDGQYMGEIVTESDGVKSPNTVCYDRNNHKLIVGQEDVNKITVFTVQ